MKIMRVVAGLAIVIGLAPAAPQAHAASPELSLPAGTLAGLIVENRERLRRGEAEAAYAALSARLGLYAGDPEFDYLLGIAALDSGHPGDALLAFERVLLVEPDHLQARAELGRAYLAAGEHENARDAFRDVASREIPPEARRLVGRYLDEIARLDARHRVAITGMVGLDIGYNDNVNVGSTSEHWSLGDGTPVVPLPVSLPQKSMVFGIDGAISISGPMDGRWRWIAGVRSSTRRFPSADTLDQMQVDLSAGVTRRQECHQLTLLGQYQDLRLDGDALRRVTGFVAQWQCNPNRQSSLGAWFQVASLSFPGQSVRDATRRTIGLSAARLLTARPGTLLSGAIHFGDERADPAWPNLAYRFVGAHASLNTPLAPNWRGEIGLYWESRRFDGPEPLFGHVRDDRQTELRISAERWLGKGWSIQPQLSLLRNSSTLAPNDFRRSQLMVRSTYRF